MRWVGFVVGVILALILNLTLAAAWDVDHTWLLGAWLMFCIGTTLFISGFLYVVGSLFDY